MENFLFENDLITKNQIGFMPNHRTSDHILVLKTICDLYKSKKKGVYLCFIDMAKAFDSVNREFLFYKLYICNFSKKFINLIKSLYFENEACIRTKGGYTKAFPIYTGTRQGCNLSPYLFNIFMNDLPKYLEENNSNFVKLNNQIISCLMYADDIVLMNETKSGLQKSLSILETYCNKWQLNINIDKSKVLILNKRFSDFDDFKINNKSIECVKSYTYLGVEINTSCTFNSAIKRLCDKATRGYYSIYKEFNFYNNTHPKVLLKLFESTITPILLYGCEIWGIFGWKKQTDKDIFKYLMNPTHCFEKLQAKMCKNILGISKYTPENIVKAELGVYPLMGKIIKQILSYWQHVLSIPANSILYNTFYCNIEMDRNNNVSYYTRMKNLLAILDMKQHIYPVEKKKIKYYSNQFRKKFNKLFEEHFFKNLQPKGKSEIYFKVKKYYGFEKYIETIENNELRRNITKIRTSSHPLPIEILRRKGIPRQNRHCNLCDSGVVGSEYHVLIECPNLEVCEMKKHLYSKITEYNPEWSKFTIEQAIKIFLLAHTYDKCLNFFAIFLGKIFKLCKIKYLK